MPGIKLTDNFGLNLEVQPAPFSAFAKYFKTLPELVAHGVELSRLVGLKLNDSAVRSLQAGLAFQQPVEIGKDAPQLSVKAGLNGSLSLVSGAAGAKRLFASDLYGDNIEIAGDACYLSLGMTASAGAGAARSVQDLNFGMDAGASTTITNYRRFAGGDDAPGLAEAVKESLAGFILPVEAGDFDAMREGDVITVAGKGSLEFSGTADLLAVANPLATVALPEPLPAIAVKEGGSIQAGASYNVSGEYQLRLHKVDGGHVRLGWYRKRGTELAVKVSASAGVSANFGKTDLFTAIVTAISGDAAADQQELERAGLPAGAIAAIQGAVKAGVERKLELALAFELGRTRSGEAAFLYEIDIAALEESGRRALAQALAGDLSALADRGNGLPGGIRELRSLLSSMRESRHTLQINLLGIYNAISIAKFALEGTVVYDDATGGLVITDKATADRFRIGAANFGADSHKLRRVLAESFLITAAYRGSRSVVSPPRLASSHTFFELRDRTNREQMQDNLQVGAALGLLAAEAGEAREEYGRTTVYAETKYDDRLTAGLFLNDRGQARAIEEYENAGRGAIQLLVRADGEDSYRRKPAIDDKLWEQMKSAGQPGFHELFPILGDLPVSVISADYTAIVWWAEAMRNTGEILAEIEQYLAANPGVAPDDPKFQRLRKHLSDHLREVAKNTREEFGRPWGLVAMDLVSGRQAEAVFRITGTRLAVSSERDKAAGAV